MRRAVSGHVHAWGVLWGDEAEDMQKGAAEVSRAGDM